MNHLSHAIETLKRAECELRDLVAEAAARGEYASVLQIASWAQSLTDLVGKKPSTCDNGVDFASSNGGVTIVAQVKNGRGRKKKRTNEYPRFYRRGDELVRVAWSRRSRSEYQHKTSGSVLKSFADTLSRVGRKGRLFSTDEILPVHDPQGAEVPSYQAYVCIGLLKLTGLIEQHGRQGYSISSPDDFTEAVDSIWRKLPSK